jgi:hypothetical protein
VYHPVAVLPARIIIRPEKKGNATGTRDGIAGFGIQSREMAEHRSLPGRAL